MFVFNTLKKNEVKRNIETPMSYHLLGFVFLSISLYLYLINSYQPSQSQTIIAISLLMLSCLFFYIMAFHSMITFDKDILIYQSFFCLIPISKVIVRGSEITSIESINHSHGQTVQKRLKFIVKTNDAEYTFGVINSIGRFDELKKYVLENVKPQKK